MDLNDLMIQLYEQSTVAMVFLDSNGSIIDINPRGLAILGFQKDDLIGKPLTNIGPTIETIFSKKVGDKHAGLLGHQYHSVRTATGDEVTLKIRPQVLTGDREYYVLLFTDILKYEITDEELNAGDIVFQRLAEVAPVGIFQTDIDGNAVFFNKMWQQIAGMSKEEGDGTGWQQSIHPEDLDMVNQEWLKYVGKKGIWELDYRYRNIKTGKVTQVKATSAPLLDNLDNIIGYVGTIQDISHIKKSINELSSLNARLERIVVERTQELIKKKNELSEAVEISRIGHWHIDPTGNSSDSSWSDRYKEIHEVSKNVKIDDVKYFMQFVHPEDLDIVNSTFKKAIEEAKSTNLEYRIITPKGKLKHLWSKIKVETNDEEEVIKIDGVIQDVTVLRSHEEQLQEALDRERELGELKSRFVSMASHEFRTPLTTILSSIELINLYGEKEQYKGQKKHIQRVSAAVGSLTRILEDFLSLERLESDNEEVNYKKLSITKLISDIKDELSVSYQDIDIISHVEGNDAIRSDSHMLKNILRNLVSNALKYSSTGSKVSIRATHSDGELVIDVEDQGIGIPLKDQQELFTNFYRASNVSNIEGTGLGLVIVKRYLDLLGGSISFKSKYEKGSTFTIRLPQES